MILTLKIIIAIGFLLAGSAKLLGAKPIAAQFEEFRLSPTIMKMIGLLEVAGAIGLFINPLTFWVAIGLALLMVGAIGNHLKVKHPFAQSAPASLLLVLSVLLIFQL